MKMESWSVDQVCNWLFQKNLGELVPKFHEEEVTGAALLALNDRMVQQLVKKIGHQAVLMDLIKKCKQQTEGTALTCEMPSSESPGTISGTPGVQQNVEQMNSFSAIESHEDGSIDQRVLKQKKNMRYVLARYKALQWTNSYILPEFPYDVKCILAERKCPDHSMRIRIIEFLQADMTKYLEGSLYPTTQQYNDVVSALLQAYPFLDEDGSGFFLWKRALKDRFKYVRRPIEDDEEVVRNKCKFGHRWGQTRKSSENRCEEVHAVHTKVKVSTPVLEVKYPFNVNMCEYSLYMEKEKRPQVDECTMAVAAYHVFGISFPKRLNTHFTSWSLLSLM